MAMKVPTIQLPNGQEMPMVGLGTCHMVDVESALEAALDAGYRLIDTAFVYKTEEAIGNVLVSKFKDGSLKREEVFIVTKLPSNGLRPDSVDYFFKKSLAALQVEYVDLYLIHFPVATKRSDNDYEFFVVTDGKAVVEDVDLLETWRVLESLVDKGLVKSIGLSNFNSQQIQRIYDGARIKPANIQVECHAYLPQYELFEFCQKLGISVTGYSPLGSPAFPDFALQNLKVEIDLPKVMEDERLKPLAEKHKKTPAQILLKFVVQRGIGVVPKSNNPERIKENLQIFDFTLDDDDMKVLKSMSKGYRYFTLDYWPNLQSHAEYPFNLPF